MSRIASEHPGAWLELGRTVWFDGPYGDRMCGEIVRTSSNPTYFHVEVNGTRYEVDLHNDRMSPRMEPF